MLGAIAGDIIGSIYEANPIKTKQFTLFRTDCHVTDDTITTLAICDGVLNSLKDGQPKKQLIRSLKALVKLYPNAGYGNSFFSWATNDTVSPYHSFGNGSAMRVSPIAWIFDDLSQVENYAKMSAEITHNHPEGIKGAQAVASAIFLARKRYPKVYIKNYIQSIYGYDLSKEIKYIRPDYTFEVSCQNSVPQAIICFLDSTSFEDAIRNAVSLGGDSDTLACITGSIAEAYYSIPKEILEYTYTYLDSVQKSLIIRFLNFIKKKSSCE